MKRTDRVGAVLVFAWVLLAGTVAPASAGGPSGPDISTCGHGNAMEAARRALAEGNKKQALEHLREAREILRECEREGEDALDYGLNPSSQKV